MVSSSHTNWKVIMPSSRSGHLEPNTEFETRTKSYCTEQFGVAVFEMVSVWNLTEVKENGLVSVFDLLKPHQNRTASQDKQVKYLCILCSLFCKHDKHNGNKGSAKPNNWLVFQWRDNRMNKNSFKKTELCEAPCPANYDCTTTIAMLSTYN